MFFDFCREPEFKTASVAARIACSQRDPMRTLWAPAGIERIGMSFEDSPPDAGPAYFDLSL
jgi:hypothetical protein